MERLEAEWRDRGRLEQLEKLKPHLTGQELRIPFHEVAAELEMTEVAVRGAMHRLRRRFGQLIRDEIAETVATPDEVDDEVRYLLAVVGLWESGTE